MTGTAWFVLPLALVANLLVWFGLNRPVDAVPWSGPVRGVSFSPYRDGQDPVLSRHPSAAEIAEDLRLLRGKVRAVRTYSSTHGLEAVPALAEVEGMAVTAGAWLDGRRWHNEIEVERLLVNLRRHRNVERAMVGNETLLRGDLDVTELTGYLRRVRAATRLPVSTAEPWHIWLKYPALAQEVDYIAIHVLPYWEGVPAEQAVAWVQARYEQVKAAFPDKPILLAEVGWPSAGGRVRSARAGAVEQAAFVRGFLDLARRQGYDYFVMEAFDQPWKVDGEGAVGAHWGLLDVGREAKFPMVGTLDANPLWRWQAAGAGLLGLAGGLLFLRRGGHLRPAGRLFFVGLLQAAASLAVWTLALPAVEPLSGLGGLVWLLLLPAQLLLVAVLLVNGLELAELVWPRRLRREFAARPGGTPKVSIHLAIHNEPPAMVKETLDALARLDYADYEVIVVDNNTRDAAVWRPVEAYCAALGERFRFFHLPAWPGYKAGALNFALRETHPEAGVIGVVDSDYQVRPDWLADLVGHFDDPGVGFVQAPQDNRDWQGDRFKTLCNWEYNGFFQIGMVQRNERNAIIQHGTMTLVRRQALERVGGWSEWTICEDAELGLRLFAEGYEGRYVNREYGRGLTPDTFAAYKGQRFRWVFGALQILRRHWRWLSDPRSPLSAGQRFHFATGWLPWFADAVHLLFSVAAIGWTLGLVLAPAWFEFPLGAFLFPTLGMFAFKLLHALWLYRRRVACSWSERLGAAVAGMGLTHTIARAVLQGFSRRGRPFFRTPKSENRPPLVQGLLMAAEESRLLLLLWGALALLFTRYDAGEPEAMVWAALLLVQSVPYLAAVVTSLVAARPPVRVAGVPPMPAAGLPSAVGSEPG